MTLLDLKAEPSIIDSDESLQLITGQIVVSQTLLVAQKLGLFRVLVGKSLTVEEISNALGVSNRSAQALVSCACSARFVCFQKPSYCLTNLGKRYLDPQSKFYYGKVLDLLSDLEAIMSTKAVENAILNNHSQADNGNDIFSNTDAIGNTQAFLEALHYKAIAPAFSWTGNYTLDQFSHFVDIGGGSGVHSIAACLNNSRLKATVCDRNPVLVHTRDYVDSYHLSDRVDLLEMDIWTDSFPEGDVLFFGDIFHDWPREKCLRLAQKAYKALTKGGIIMLHEMLFDEGKTGPLLTAAYNMKMMLWTEGQQFSQKEMVELLEEAGFLDVDVQQSLGNWELVVGRK